MIVWCKLEGSQQIISAVAFTSFRKTVCKTSCLFSLSLSLFLLGGPTASRLLHLTTKTSWKGLKIGTKPRVLGKNHEKSGTLRSQVCSAPTTGRFLVSLRLGSKPVFLMTWNDRYMDSRYSLQLRNHRIQLPLDSNSKGSFFKMKSEEHEFSRDFCWNNLTWISLISPRPFW